MFPRKCTLRSWRAWEMKLANDWKKVIKRAWSIRWMVIAGLLTGLEAILPYVTESIPRGVMAILSFVAIGGGFISRIVVQKNYDD